MYCRNNMYMSIYELSTGFVWELVELGYVAKRRDSPNTEMKFDA